MAKTVSTISEKYLLDALDRVARNPSGYSVLYVNVSKLKPKNRHPEFIKIFAKLFDSVTGSAKGTLFVLGNGDFAILGREITHEIVEDAVKKLRDGLSADPVLHSKDSREFFEIYDFPQDFPSFYSYIEEMVENAAQRTREDSLPQKRPVAAGEIEDLILALDDIDIAEIVKRQSVLRIKGAGQFEVTLDKKTMEAFFGSDIKNWPKEISLNLNLSSVFSKEFVEFGRNFVKPGQKIIVEVQLMDVFNNLPLYFQAQDILHHGGHKLLIDAVSPTALKMLNIKRVKPDMIKIFWEPLLEDDIDNEDLKKTIEFLGRENVILAKCDSERAIRWGVRYGITAFQGPYIDTLEVALIRSKCPHAKECSAADCLKRKRRLAGWFRDECKDKEVLEYLLG